MSAPVFWGGVILATVALAAVIVAVVSVKLMWRAEARQVVAEDEARWLRGYAIDIGFRLRPPMSAAALLDFIEDTKPAHVPLAGLLREIEAAAARRETAQREESYR